MLTHWRKSMRLTGFDYATAEAYFVTICTAGRTPLFGSIEAGRLYPTPAALIAQQCWQLIPQHHPQAYLDAFGLMPNHLHAILALGASSVPVVGAPDSAPSPSQSPPTLGTILRIFKASVSKRMRLELGWQLPVWQTNYYEHIIRNDHDLENIQRYIAENPLRWHLDPENPRSPNWEGALSGAATSCGFAGDQSPNRPAGA